MMHGEGTFTAAAGGVITGVWENNKLMEHKLR